MNWMAAQEFANRFRSADTCSMCGAFAQQAAVIGIKHELQPAQGADVWETHLAIDTIRAVTGWEPVVPQIEGLTPVWRSETSHTIR
jgi:hypothetical protein